MDNELNSMCLTPTVLEAGLMLEKAGEIWITDAGLFAMAGMMAYDLDNESREHCLRGFMRALSAARTGGMDPQMETVILRAFFKEVVPGDGSQEGTALASLCRHVATFVGVGRMGELIEGKKAH